MQMVLEQAKNSQKIYMEAPRMSPYSETSTSADISLRTFNEKVSEDELVWHRDREDRIVKALHPTDWQVQLENELPVPFTEIFIHKGLYHRVIKGTGTLNIQVEKFRD